jgi:hypothetical protein
MTTKETKGSKKGVGVLFYIRKDTWEEFCSIPKKRGQSTFDMLRNVIRNAIIDAEIIGDIE